MFLSWATKGIPGERCQPDAVERCHEHGHPGGSAQPYLVLFRFQDEHRCFRIAFAQRIFRPLASVAGVAPTLAVPKQPAIIPNSRVVGSTAHCSGIDGDVSDTAAGLLNRTGRSPV
jgi:hypothetical protein